MTSTEDVQAYEAKFENQREKLAEADIPEADREAIQGFLRYEVSQKSINQGTIVSHINRLRLSSERADVPLTEMREDDVDTLLFSLTHDYGLSEGTVRNYRKALRVFYDWQGEEWAEDINIGASPERKVDPNDLLEDDEVMALLNAADRPRDKAMVALMADTGLRIGAIASLRIRDVDFEGRAATVTINEQANVKGASGTVPLTWSEGHLANWLDVHPRRDEPDAALIHKTAHYDGEDDGAMTYQYLASRVKKLADEADIDRERVNTHNFRKTAISNWLREGLSDKAIKHRATWDVDTDMFKVYDGVRDEEMNDVVLDHYGVEGERESSTPDIGQCKRCQTTLSASHEYCPGCGAPRSQAAAEALDRGTGAAREEMVDADDGTVRSFAHEAAEVVESDPNAARALRDELADRIDE